MKEKKRKDPYVDYFLKYEGNYACAVTGKKKGVIDLSGNIIIPIQYEQVFLPKTVDGLFVVVSKKKFGFVNKQNEVVIPLEYDYAEPFSEENLALVCKDGKFGFIDTNKNIIIPPDYIFARSFSEGLAAVQTENQMIGYIDTRGELVIPMRFAYADDFQHGLAVVETNADQYGDGLCGMINRAGKEVIKCQYRDLFFISDDIVKGYSLDESIVYFDKYGNTITRYSNYKELNYFVNGYASVSRNGEYGLIDKSGELVIPYKYNSALVLEKGSDLVTTSRGSLSFGAFSLKTGQEIIPFVYPYVANLGQNRYLVENLDRRSRKLVDEYNNTIFKSQRNFINKNTPIYILILAVVAYWFFFT